jgi:diguanylate cyclase (GGDEF)-like protein/PAS domain S-box-containing protein
MPNPTKSPLVNDNAGPAKMQGRAAVHLDGAATERNRSARALRASELRYRRVFETAPFGIVVLDAETGVVTDVNRYVCDLLGHPATEIVGQPLWNAAGFRTAAQSKHRFRELMYETNVRYADLPLETRHGAVKRVEFISTLYLVDGRPFVQCNIRDVTDRIKAEQGARQQQVDLEATISALRTADPTTHDELTGLLNPCYLEESLPRELHRAARGKYPLTIGVLDIDHLARINRDFGRDAGDALMREVGRVLREHLRKSDMACRYTDDEFVVVLGQSSPGAAHDRLEKIRTAVQSLDMRHGNRQLDRVTVSAGVVSAGEDGNTSRELLRAARRALAAAKRAGGDRIIMHQSQEQESHA